MSTSLHRPNTIPRRPPASSLSPIVQSMQRALALVRNSQTLAALAMTQRPFERWLSLLFLLSLALLNPWVRGDGIGYYAFVRAPLVEHSLNFEHDYINGNEGFRASRLDEHGQPKPLFRTVTGHLDNHFTVGPAILWTPFLLPAHAGVLLARAFGSDVPADGFSAPYRMAMALGTAFWAFLGLLLSFRVARVYAGDLWAFFASIAIWWASSLPVYMYFNPAWSHAHSAFTVALFVWYWHKTRDQRTLRQWCWLGLISGLMLNVYYPNVMLLMALVVEAIRDYIDALRETDSRTRLAPLFARHLLFVALLLLCLIPTFATRYIIYGSPFATGYGPVQTWAWRSPYFLAVLFSSEHGLFSWTPILLLAAIGLVLFRWREPRVGTPLLATALAFYVFIACYPDWAGISSFGNRFFVSLTSLFILGLGFLLARIAAMFRTQRSAVAVSTAVLALFIFWNGAFMFQWGEHLIPPRGPISWSAMIRNQFTVVPRQIFTRFENYLLHRHDTMRQIEERDLEMLKQSPPQ